MRPLPKNPTPVLSSNWKNKTTFKHKIPQVQIKLDSIINQQQYAKNNNTHQKDQIQQQIPTHQIKIRYQNKKHQSYNINPLPDQQTFRPSLSDQQNYKINHYRHVNKNNPSHIKNQITNSNNNTSFIESVNKVKQIPKKPSITFLSSKSSKYVTNQSNYSQSTPIKRIQYLRDITSSKKVHQIQQKEHNQNQNQIKGKDKNRNDNKIRQKRNKSFSSIKSISVKQSIQLENKIHKRQSSLESLSQLLNKNQITQNKPQSNLSHYDNIDSKRSYQKQSNFSMRSYIQNVYQHPFSPSPYKKYTPQQITATPTIKYSTSNKKDDQTPSPLFKPKQYHYQSVQNPIHSVSPNIVQNLSNPYYIQQDSKQKFQDSQQEKNNKKLKSKKIQISHFSITKQKINELKKKFQSQLNNQQYLKANYPYVSNFLTQKQKQSSKNSSQRIKDKHKKDKIKNTPLQLKSGKKLTQKLQSSSGKASSKHSKKINLNKSSLPLQQQNRQYQVNFDDYALTELPLQIDFRRDKSNNFSLSHQDSYLKINRKIERNSKQILRQKFGMGIDQAIAQVFRYCIGCEHPILQINIINHQKNCDQLINIYNKNLKQLKGYLNNKISKFKSQIDGQILNVDNNILKRQLQGLKTCINDWLKKSLSKNMPDSQYHRLYQNVKQNYNVGIFKTIQSVNKMDWFLRVRGRVEQALLRQQIGYQVG